MARSYRDEASPRLYNRDEIPEEEITDHSTMQVFRGQNLMLGFCTLTPEIDEFAPYSHPWEQITMVTRGTCDVLVGDEVMSASQGDVFAVPPNVEHAVRVTGDEECELVDFWPLVEEYLEYTAYQDEFADEDS